MKSYLCRLALILWLLPVGLSFASTTLRLQQVTENVYAIVGELGNRTPQNFGNNATFGFVVTTDGVVLIDPGGTWRGAAEIHRLIQRVTARPVTIVINTGGQDHRWLGNGYFQARGARIIAHAKAVQDQKARFRDQFFMLGNLVGNAGIEGTDPVYADQTIAEPFTLRHGGVEFRLVHAGPAHTPGDIFVWLPRQRVMFSGDIVYTERMLAVGSQSNSKGWIDAFETMAAFEPLHLVPGHGRPTRLAVARRDTHDYLVYLRDAVAEFMDGGGDISEIGRIDQAKFARLLNYEMLAGRNAQQVFIEMEWE